MGFFKTLFGIDDADSNVKKEVNEVSDSIKKEVRENFLRDFFGVDLKNSPTKEWDLIDSVKNTSGDVVRTYQCRVSSPYFDSCEAKVIGNSATNYFFENDYSWEKAFDVVFLIERNMLRGGIYNNVECAQKYRNEISNDMCFLEWSVDGLDIRFYRDGDDGTMTLGIWTKFYNKELDTTKEENAKTSHKSKLHSDIRLYYDDVDGNECEKLIRDGEIWTTITGIRFRKDPERIMSSLYEGATVVLKPEPENPYDPYAVAIYFKNELIGYVPKKDVPAILTCISPNGTEARIDKIEEKFIRVILDGTMEYINTHACLSKFKIMVVKDEEDAQFFYSGNDSFVVDEDDDEDDDDDDEETEYVNKEITEVLPASYETLITVRDNIERWLDGESPIFIGMLRNGMPTYINLTSNETLCIRNAEMEECLRKGYKVGFVITGLSDNEDLSVKIGIKMNVYFEKAFLERKLKDLEQEMADCHKAMNILNEGIEKATGNNVTLEGEYMIEGDEEFGEDEMANWEEYEIKMPFTENNRQQFMDIYEYLITGKFMCFKGDKYSGIGIYYCKKYDSYLKFRDPKIDAHLQRGNKVAFYIQNLDMADRTKDIQLTIAINFY